MTPPAKSSPPPETLDLAGLRSAQGRIRRLWTAHDSLGRTRSAAALEQALRVIDDEIEHAQAVAAAAAQH